MADYYAGIDDDPFSFQGAMAQPTNTAPNREEPVMSGALPSGYVHDYNIPFKGVIHHTVRTNNQFVKIRPLPYFDIQTRNGNLNTVSFQTTFQVQLNDGQVVQAEQVQSAPDIPNNAKRSAQVQSIQDVTNNAKEPEQKAKQIQNGSGSDEVAASQKKKKQKQKQKPTADVPVPAPAPPDPQPQAKSHNSSKKGDKKVEPEIPDHVSSSSSSSGSSLKTWRGVGHYDPNKGWKVNETPPSSVDSFDDGAKDAKPPSSKKSGKGDKNKDSNDKKNGSDDKKASNDVKKSSKHVAKDKDGGSPKGSKKDGGSQKSAKKDSGSDKSSKKAGSSDKGSKKDDGSSKSGKGLSHSSKSKRPPENPYMAMYGLSGPQPPWGTAPPFAGAPWPYPQPGAGAQMPYPQPMPGQQMPYPQYMPGGINANALYGPFGAGFAPPPQDPGNDFDFTVPPPPNWAPPGTAERAKLVADEADTTVQIVADATSQNKATTPSDAQNNSVKEATPIDVAVVPVDAEGIAAEVAQDVMPSSKAGSKATVTKIPGAVPSQRSDSHKSVSHSVKSFHTTSSEQRRKVVYVSKDDRYFTLRFNFDELKHLGDDAASRAGTSKAMPAAEQHPPSHHSSGRFATELSPKNLAAVGNIPVSELLRKGDKADHSKKQTATETKPKHTQSKSAAPVDSNSFVAGTKNTHESGVDPNPHKIVKQLFDITIHDKQSSKRQSPRSHAHRDRSPSVRPEDSISQASSEHHHSRAEHKDKPRNSYELRQEGRAHALSTIHPWDSISQVSTSPAQKQRSASKAERGSNAPDQGLLLRVPTVVSNYKSATVESVSSNNSSHGRAVAPNEGVHISIRRVSDDSPPRDVHQRMDGSSSEPDRRSHQSKERDRVYSQHPRSTTSSRSDKSSDALHSQSSRSSSHREYNQLSRRSTNHDSHHSNSPSRHSGQSSRTRSPHSPSAELQAPNARRRQGNGRDDPVIVRVESRRIYDEDSVDEQRRHRERARQRRDEDDREDPNLRRRTFVRVQTHAPRAPSQHSRVVTIASEDTTARRRSYRRPEWLGS